MLERVSEGNSMDPQVCTSAEFHNKAGEIQKIFASIWVLSKDLLMPYRSLQRLDLILLNESCLNMNKLENFSNKTCSPGSIF